MGAKKVIGIVVIVFAVIGAINCINWFVYPFTSAHPNYAEVEAVFNKLQIPSDWTETSRDEIKGLRGRRCPVESDGCFSKQVTYSNPKDIEAVKNVVLSSGCVTVEMSDNAQVGDPKESISYMCMSGAIRVSGSWERINGETRARITTWSR